MNAPRLLLFTDRSQLPPGRGLAAAVRACAGAGLTHVVVRELDLPAAERLRLVEDLAAVDGLTVLASRVPVAGAAGLHLAAGQPRPAAGWFGRSCHDLSEVRQAAAQGAAYVTLSPYAATASKPGYGPPVARSDYAGDHGVPVLALGGIGPDNAAEARASGAHGVAVMGCVMRAADPGAVVARLLEETGP
jgi:thiamine-phosphate pyrophosphorylase